MEKHPDGLFEFLNARFLIAVFVIVATPAFASGSVFGADNDATVDRAELRSQAAVMTGLAQGYRHVYRRPYAYATPVYIPPPMYYEPSRTPGISLLFPLDLLRREDPSRR